MRELTQFSEPELRKELRRRRKLRKEVKRKAHGEPKRRKGLGCRIGDRDEAEKLRRGYVEAGSFVRRDGSEKLVGMDWIKRKGELYERSNGLCERWRVLRKAHADGCSGRNEEPHHVIKRSVRRDDRLGNLAGISHACHSAEDPRRTRFGEQQKRVGG